MVAMGKIKKKISKVASPKLKKPFSKPMKAVKPKKKLAKPSKKPKKEIEGNFSAMSVDDFFEETLDDSNSDDANETLSGDEGPHNEFAEEEAETEEPQSNKDEAEEESEGSANSGDEDEVEAHKKSLANLKDTDPDFYKFLEEDDEFDLLKFGSDDEASEGDEEDLHRPAAELEVASDESDFEAKADDEKEAVADKLKVKDHGVITQKMLKAWQHNIQTDTSNKTIAAVIEAFHAARVNVSPVEEDVAPSRYQVDGAAIFNGIVNLCVMQLEPALRRFLRMAEGSKQPPHKCKRFSKIKKSLQVYLTDLAHLLTFLRNAHHQRMFLKHLHGLSSFLTSFPNVTKSLIKMLIVEIWGKASDSVVLVVVFLCILRITNGQRARLLDTVLKAMYMTYVKNSKFVSVGNLASINFMRRSLAEMFALDANLGYQHAFLYVRQLAIHLRNAITVNKKENVQAVYNWQFVNSLRLWGTLLGHGYHKPQFQQLVYPFVQVALGTLKLVPTAQYYPLRFHVVQVLIEFSRDSGVFVPILPFILEVLNAYDFDKKHQKVSMKPMQFLSLLRASKSQMSENGFKDAVIEKVYGSLLEYLANNAHSIAFPDLSFVCRVQIKQFLKKCHNANYNRKMKQVLEKIEQNSAFIEKERGKMTMKLTDVKLIDGFESQIKARGTPLATFFDSWHKVHTAKKNKQLTSNKELGDYDLPKLKKRRKIDEGQSKKDDGGPMELFPSDSEEEEVKVKEGDEKKRRGVRGGKNKKKKRGVMRDESGPVVDDGEKDVVEDIDVDDW